MPEEESRRPRRSDEVETTELEDGLVVYQVRPERVHHLNNTAAFVFALSTGDRTVAEIAEECRQHFGLDAPPLAAVRTCVEDLRSLRLVS